MFWPALPVTRRKRPLDIYHFFKEEGVEFIQFTPVVERLSGTPISPQGLRLAGPAALDTKGQQRK